MNHLGKLFFNLSILNFLKEIWAEVSTLHKKNPTQSQWLFGFAKQAKLPKAVKKCLLGNSKFPFGLPEFCLYQMDELYENLHKTN